MEHDLNRIIKKITDTLSYSSYNRYQILPNAADVLTAKNTPQQNAKVIIENVYESLEQNYLNRPNKEESKILFDEHVVYILDHCRTPAIAGGRLRLDFTHTVPGGVVRGCPPATCAYNNYHLKTTHTLLMEERLSWGNDTGKIIRESSREVLNGSTWLRHMLILASTVYLRYQNETARQEELKEYLLHTIQTVHDVLKIYLSNQRQVQVSKLRQYFLRPATKDLCALALLKYFDTTKIISNLPYFNEINQIITTFDLTENALLQRQEQLEQLQSINIIKRPELKKFLKTRLRLSALMMDRLLFEECMSDNRSLSMLLLTEVIMDLYLQDTETKHTFLFLLRGLSKDQCINLIYFWLQINKDNHAEYLKKKCPEIDDKELTERSYKIESVFHNLIHQLMNMLGNHQEQLGYIASAVTYNASLDIKQHVKEFTGNIANYVFRNSPICDISNVTRSPLTGKLSEIQYDELAHYPGIQSCFAKYLDNLNPAVMNKIEASDMLPPEKMKQFCQEFWLAYIYAMWMEYKPAIDNVRDTTFQIIDFWLERVLRNQKKYPNLYAALETSLLDYQSSANKRLNFFLKYRFGANSLIAKKIAVTEAIRKAKPELDSAAIIPNAEKNIFIEELHARKDSIYAQLDFLNQWVQQNKTNDPQYQDYFSLAVDYLIDITPFSQLLTHPAINDVNFNGYEPQLNTWVLDSSSARNMILLFLFLHPNYTENKFTTELYLIVTRVFQVIDAQFDCSSNTHSNFHLIYDELAMHRFFWREVGDAFCRIFFNNTFIKFVSEEFNFRPRDFLTAPPTPPPVEPVVPEVLTDREPVAEKKDSISPKSLKRQRQKERKAQAIALKATQSNVIEVPETEIEVEVEVEVEVEPNLIPQAPFIEPDPEDEPKENIKNISNQTPIPAVERPLPVRSRPRLIREQITNILKELISWNENKLTGLGEEHRLTPHYKNLVEQLKVFKAVSVTLRNQLNKENVGKTIRVPFAEQPITDANIREQFQLYQNLIHELTTLTKDQTILGLAEQLAQLNYNDLMQHALYARLKLPEKMPIIERLVALMGKHAQVLVFGSALYMEHPLDIDTRFIWKDSSCTIEDIKKSFVNIMEQAGFNVIFVVNLFGGASFKLKAKGEGYDESNHKEIDLILLVNNPAERLMQLHHNSHSSAALDAATGHIYCTDEAAEQILNNTFTIGSYTTENPIESYKIKVHVLNSLMRAWAESKNGSLELHADAHSLIKQIACHQGNWAALKKADEKLEAALRGMIVRHIQHYQPGVTYQIRTEILFNFLALLNIKSINQSLKNQLHKNISPYFSAGANSALNTLLGICQRLNGTVKTPELLNAPAQQWGFFNNTSIPTNSGQASVRDATARLELAQMIPWQL